MLKGFIIYRYVTPTDCDKEFEEAVLDELKGYVVCFGRKKSVLPHVKVKIEIIKVNNLDSDDISKHKKWWHKLVDWFKKVGK